MAEHPNGRKAIDRMTRDLKTSGYSTEQAKKKATEAAIRYDRKQSK